MGRSRRTAAPTVDRPHRTDRPIGVAGQAIPWRRVRRLMGSQSPTTTSYPSVAASASRTDARPTVERTRAGHAARSNLIAGAGR